MKMKRVVCTIMAALMITVGMPQAAFAGVTLRDNANLPDGTTAAANENVRVSIIMEERPLMKQGFQVQSISKNRAALNERAALIAQQEEMEEIISEEVLGGEALDVHWNLTMGVNAIAATVNEADIEAIEALDGVAAVIRNVIFYTNQSSVNNAGTNMYYSSDMIGSTTAWALGYTGEGTRVGIIDTGIDVNHEAFDGDAFIYSLEQNASAAGILDSSEYISSLNLLTSSGVETVFNGKALNIEKKDNVSASGTYHSEKIPYAANYTEKGPATYVGHDDPADSNGFHGSHVAGIAAANKYVSRGGIYREALSETRVQGVAPDAQLLVFKVFGKEQVGAYDVDILAAMEDALMLGCDVINLSLGSVAEQSGRDYSYCRKKEQYLNEMSIFMDTAANIVYSAGNESSWSDMMYLEYLPEDNAMFSTLGGAGSQYQYFTVASCDNKGKVSNCIKQGENKYPYSETTECDTILPMINLIPDGESEKEYGYLYVDAPGSESDFAAVSDLLEGKIAVCNRGDLSFREKAVNAISAGAIATIIVNNVSDAVSMNFNGYTLTNPAIIISMADGEKMKAASTSSSSIGGFEYYTGSIEIERELVSLLGDGPVKMSSFSSWGTTSLLELKPEITAPGGNIYSVKGATNGESAGYECDSGTSMAAPQISGMIAVLKEYFRSTSGSALWAKATGAGFNERALAHSLLMSTAEPMKDGDNYYSVLNQGAGMANLEKAIEADCFIKMLTSPGHPTTIMGLDNEGKVKVELGEDPNRKGSYNFDFVIYNTSSNAITFNFSEDIFTQKIENGVRLEETVPIKHSCSYDVGGSSVVVEGNSIKTVQCGLSLNSGTGGDSISKYDCKGNYIEGYIFLEADSGEKHSIPVLGYYGSWTEPTMFDDQITPFGNVLLGTDAAGDKYYLNFNSDINPIGHDDDLYPERASLNGNYRLGDNYVTLIRNAGAVRLILKNDTKGTVLCSDSAVNVPNIVAIQDENGDLIAYNRLLQADDNAWVSMKGYSLSGCDNGDRLTVRLEAVPELYVKEVAADRMNITDSEWTALEAKLTTGAIKESSFYIDNEKPTITAIDWKTTPGSLYFTAKDNRFVAGAQLYDARTNSLVATVGAIQDSDLAVNADNDCVITDIQDKSYILRVYDYANNYVDCTVGDKPAVNPPSGGGGGGGKVIQPPETEPLPILPNVAPEDLPPAPGMEKLADVSADRWFYTAVNYVLTTGLMTGTSAESFAPQAPSGRAMVATVLYRMAGEPEITEEMLAACPFTDLGSGSWYERAVIWAYYNGIVNGTGEGIFDPNADVTRQQLAAMFARYEEKCGTGGTAVDTTKKVEGFGDGASVADWAQDSMNWAVQTGLIKGSDGKLLPNKETTRAELATMLMNYTT